MSARGNLDLAISEFEQGIGSSETEVEAEEDELDADVKEKHDDLKNAVKRFSDEWKGIDKTVVEVDGTRRYQKSPCRKGENREGCHKVA